MTRKELNLYQSLHTKNGRFERKQYLIEGMHLVEEALLSGVKLDKVLFHHRLLEKKGNHLLQMAEENNIPIQAVDTISLKRICTTKNQQSILAVAPMPSLDHRITKSAIYLYKINDPGNLGTIIRTASWFDLSHIILSPESCDPFNPKVVRATQGAIFHIALSINKDVSFLKSFLKSHHMLVSHQLCRRFPDIKGPFIAVFGSESIGLKDFHPDFKYDKFGFPRRGYGDSLNLAISVGIFLDRLNKASF